MSSYGKKLPKVSILWLNYNSMKIIDIVEKSLESILKLDYPNYELIIIDGGSTDGSYEYINKYISKIKVPQHVTIKVIKLSKNIGAPASYNIGFKLIDPLSKYFVHMDNDVVVFKHGLKELITIMEKYSQIGAIQGIIYHPDRKYPGVSVIDELLNNWPVNLKVKQNDKSSLRKPKLIFSQWVHGAYSVYRTNAVKKCLGEEPFITEFFLYRDDVHPGLKLWDCGYKVVVLPKIVGIHYGGFSQRKKRSAKHMYYGYRSRVVLLELTNARYKILSHLATLRLILFKEWKYKKYAIRGYIDGFFVLNRIRHKINISKEYKRKYMLNTSNIPLIRIPLHIALISVVSGRKLADYVKSSAEKLII